MKNELESLRLKVAELQRKCGQLEMNLRETEGRFLKIFHASSNMMTITTLKDGRMIDLNDASAGLGGFKREDLIGSLPVNNTLFVDPTLADTLVEKLREQGNIRNMEAKVRTKTGEIRTILISADPITVNEEPCLLGISVDISAREAAADALRRSEEKYRMLVENSLQGVAIIQDNHFVFCNGTYAKMTGYSVEEHLAMTPEEMGRMIHPEDRPIVRGRYQDRLAGKPVPPNYEYRGIKRDGTSFWLQVFASLAEYNGRPATQLVYVDITERKLAENALRESEERFRLIAETIDEIFWIFDVEKDAMTYISPAHDRIWGYPRAQIADRNNPFWDPIHPDDREQVLSTMADAKIGKPINNEIRIIRPDGSMRYVQNRGFPVCDKAGKVKYCVGVGQDVTAWKLAEEALRESREHLNQIINCIGDPVFVKDREHKFMLINNAFCAYFNRPSEALLGETGLESMPQDLAKSIFESEEQVFRTGKESISEDNLSSWQGTAHILMTKKSLLTDSSGKKQIIGVMRDITQYKQLEAQFLQAQKMEAIGILAGGVAHDFNNLLNVINGYSELILDDLTPDNPMRKDIEQIKEAGKRAATLTSQLLAFGRKQIMQPEVLSLNIVVSQMNTMLRRLIGEDIELVSIGHPNLRFINADPGQIQQIVMNLVVNARDAMPRGGKLTIETSNVDLDEDYAKRHSMVKAGPYVMLAISDNGFGMDEETQSHLFEPFFTTKQKGKGTGLGLSTVYGIVKQSNGFIWVYSEPGQGTTFKIYFPQAPGIEDLAVEGKEVEPALHGSETVLVVEDEMAVRELTGRILRDRGYTVFEAAGGQEALAIAQEYAGDIHLILTDVIMPGISGSTLVARLESARPGIKSLYVSGYTDNAIVHHGILDSNVAFLQKPFTVEGLIRKVREVLNP